MKPILWRLPDLGEVPEGRFALARDLYSLPDEESALGEVHRAGLRLEIGPAPSVLVLSLSSPVPNRGREEARAVLGDFLNALLRQTVERRLRSSDPEP